MNKATVAHSSRKSKRRATLAEYVAALDAAGLRPIGELDALFPETDPGRFLETFDLYALGHMQIKQFSLASDTGLPWPSGDPVEFANWLRDNEIQIWRKTFLGTRRSYRWMGLYRIILAKRNEVIL